MRWLFFSYSLPAEPSKARVYVWRQLRKLGAVNYQSVWAIPHSAERLNELKKLIEDIEKYQGASLLIAGNILLKGQEEGIIKAFVDSRNEEYREIIDKCEAFFKEIEYEISRQNFIFAEVEENEEELDKLKQWLKKVEKRDILKPPLRKTAIDKVKMCEKIFEDFARRVYEHSHPKRK
ncbi:MAG: chromate resistance protein ChrB [Deltaproteobacteria bacterium]|nr:chromate resistance protein ChrB [Deltaproteobacteria bacterium]